MSKIFKKKSYISIFLVFLFLLISTILPGFLHNKVNTAYAKSTTIISFKSGSFSSHSSTRGSYHSSKSQGGSFKSGSFSKPNSEYKSNKSSSSGGGDFKSGSFSNSTKSYNKKTNNSSSTQSYNKGNNRRSFFPIPITIPWGHNYSSTSSYGQSSVLSRFFWGFVKFIVVILILIFIINRINKFRKK